MREPVLLTVYFDGSCPLCQREMAMYRRLPQASRVAWVDVSGVGGELPSLGPGLSCERAMARFHVRDSQGRLWRIFPGWRYLGYASAWPPLSWLFELAYRLFLPIRPALQRLFSAKNQIY